jgi:hypothetical protein
VDEGSASSVLCDIKLQVRFEHFEDRIQIRLPTHDFRIPIEQVKAAQTGSRRAVADQEGVQPFDDRRIGGLPPGW